jgi:uncharacterized protein YbjT (DUF2867 family)
VTDPPALIGAAFDHAPPHPDQRPGDEATPKFGRSMGKNRAGPLVVGASGAIGSALVDHLLSLGERPTPAGRNPEALAERWPGLPPARVDVLVPGTLVEPLAAVDVAYYLVHSMGAGAAFRARDREGATNFARAAASAGVRRIVYLGGLGRDDDDLSAHLSSRHETGRILAEHGPEVVELRAGIVIGARSASFRMLHDLVRRLPVMIVPRWVNTRTQPIAIADVVRYLSAARHVATSEHHTIVEVGGPDVLTFREMMLTLARKEGRRPLILGVPVLTPRLSAMWCGLTTSVSVDVARPLVLGMRNETVVRDERAATLFPQIRPMSFDQAIERALAGA